MWQFHQLPSFLGNDEDGRVLELNRTTAKIRIHPIILSCNAPLLLLTATCPERCLGQMADWPKDGLRNSNLILLKTLAFSN
jgi:hypothetical protein